MLNSEFIKNLKIKNESLDSDIKLKTYMNVVRNQNVIENLRVLFEEFLSDSNMDIREKSKGIIKILNSNF
jgi:hypothetical protein